VKALIKVGYGCNENCTFCHTLDVRHVEGSAAEVHAKIDRAARLGHTMVVLSGGEPTIRRELTEWAAHVASLGLDFGLVTNGLIFAYPDAVGKLLKHRLKYVYMSLHGGSAPVHDRLVRAHTFDQARAALGNLAGRGLDFTINTVITQQNVDELEPMVDLLLPYPDVVLKFSMVQPKGGGDKAFQALMPRVAHVAERVRAALAYGEAKVAAAGARGPRFAHDGIPLCLLPGYEALYDDLKTHQFATMVEIGEPDFFPVDDRDKIQPPPCAGCALRGPCPGLYRGYHEIFGDGELRPVGERARSNSFNYVFETLLPPAAGDACPLRDDGVTPWDRARHLFVRNGDRLARFRTQTRDFADVELDAVKHGLGQLYVDRSQKPAPDDFPRDLVKLRRSALCDPCPEKPRCTGLYEPVFEDVFGRDDARVREIVAALAGDVLDVGCGEGPYDELLEPLGRAGVIRYVGLDPDRARVERLRARRPWADLRCGDAETISVEELGRFDHVLLLRSWNHLRDPRRALARLVEAMRPGATLTIVDNVAFGLARTRAQAARAERSPSGFEHFRNDGAEDAQRAVQDLPLALVERRDVGRETSNQWLVRYGRL
jgi:MoaA/NifB/PqqE/SkfB family radical SAM enzyme/SAM-dependent methyltransferase